MTGKCIDNGIVNMPNIFQLNCSVMQVWGVLSEYSAIQWLFVWQWLSWESLSKLFSNAKYNISYQRYNINLIDLIMICNLPELWCLKRRRDVRRRCNIKHFVSFVRGVVLNIARKGKKKKLFLIKIKVIKEKIKSSCSMATSYERGQPSSN